MNNQYEPLANDNFYTAPDRTPVAPADGPSYFQTPSKEKASPKPPILPSPPPPPESSQKSTVSKSVKSVKSQDPTDLRSEDNQSKVKSKKKKPKKVDGEDSEKNPLIDVEKQEETLRSSLRYDRYFDLQEKKAKRTKICILASTGILILIGIILTILILIIFFTECFNNCVDLA